MTQSANYVDFQVVKKTVSMLQILEHYHLADNFKRGGNGDSLTGACPLHKGENPTHFRVSLSKNCWNCFGKCKRGGNILDFVSRMEDCSIREAALRISEWFRLSGGQSPEQERKPSQKEAHRTSKRQTNSGISEILDENAPNKPLGFELQHLDQEHPYFAERGLTHDTVLAFGLGYCGKGSMAGRIVIPIHNVKGELVAYAGRWPGEPADDAPKYKLPTGFRKSMEVFNLHRAIEDAPEEPLLIVEGFFDAIRLWQNGASKVVAIMGSNFSPAQESLILGQTAPDTRILVMLDEDDAGRTGRDNIVLRLALHRFVRACQFENEGFQPEHLEPEQLADLIA
jgi:DNA primase